MNLGALPQDFHPSAWAAVQDSQGPLAPCCPTPSTGDFLLFSLAIYILIPPALAPNPFVLPPLPPPVPGPTSNSSPLSQLWHTRVCTLPPTRKVAKTRRMRGAANRKLKPTPLGSVTDASRERGHWLPPTPVHTHARTSLARELAPGLSLPGRGAGQRQPPAWEGGLRKLLPIHSSSLGPCWA